MPVVSSSVTVGTSSTLVLLSSKELAAKRTKLVLCNASTEHMYLGFDAPAVIGSGIKLSAGQTMTISSGEDDVFVQSTVYAISAIGGSNITIAYA